MSRIALIPLVALLACGRDPEPEPGPEPEPEPTLCETLGLSEVAFDGSATEDPKRRDLAPDFTVPLLGGEEFTLSERWTGCDVLVVVTSAQAISSSNRTSVWNTDLGELLARSPRNARYLFVARAGSDPAADDLLRTIRVQRDDALAALSEEDAAWWGDRVHIARPRSANLDNWLGRVLTDGHGAPGLAIDRFQKVRGVGNFAAVDAYNQTLANSGAWPWEARLYTVAKEAHYLNYEAERAYALAEVDALVVPVLPGDVGSEFIDTEVTLPDAATIAAYDTLEIEVVMECPDPDAPEFGNCGPWDYLAHLWVEDEGGNRLEMARFITTYHRESHWVVDASHALPWIAQGGTRKLRYLWAPPWNVQPTGVTLNLRFSKQRDDLRPVETIPLYTGGALNATYNESRPPMQVEIPAGAKKVELVALITGHGAATSNCAEFCNHQHRFNVGSQEVFWEFPEASGTYACRDAVPDGTVPNQGGTWWFGRGGWCPGVEVRPLVADVTAAATAGTVDVSYAATVNGRATNGDFGNVVLSSWLVVYR
jgi:hypothetical protein